MSFKDNFNFQLSGDQKNPKLVFLHGLMGSSNNWRKITPSFENHFQILTYDQRGHGRSFRPPSGYSPEDYAQDLKTLIDDLGWAEIFLVGHSMGGRNALTFAALNPHRVKKLVIEDIGPEGSAQAVRKIEVILSLIPTPFLNKREARNFMLNEFVHNFQPGSGAETLAQFVYTNIEEKPNGTTDWRFSKEAILESARAGRSQDRWHYLPQIKCPTLWIRGDKSDELSLETYSKILQQNSLFVGKEIKDSGHWVHFDQPDKFINSTREFFGL